MRTRSKLLLSALAAALVLSMAVGSASANRLASNSTSFSLTWARLTLAPSLGSSVICPVTLAGSFHSRTITKTLESLIGYVTSASVGAAGRTTATCEGGTATILSATLPWHVRYGGFTGTLPNITGVILRLVGASFQINNGSLACLAATTAARPAIGTAAREAGGAITGLRTDETASIPLTGGGGLCTLATGRFIGSGGVTGDGGAAIRITLI